MHLSQDFHCAFADLSSLGASVYLAIDLGGMDAMAIIAKGDTLLTQLTGSEFNIVSKVDPQLGKIGVALVLNEMLEPIRLPFVVATLKPTMVRASFVLSRRVFLKVYCSPRLILFSVSFFPLLGLYKSSKVLSSTSLKELRIQVVIE